MRPIDSSMLPAATAPSSTRTRWSITVLSPRVFVLPTSRSLFLLSCLWMFGFASQGVEANAKDASVEQGTAAHQSKESGGFRVMSWNIWRGGREDGEEEGPARVVDVIRDSGADVVAMQETYGSGERIAAALGFHFFPRGTNVSILSRYPVLEDLSVSTDFHCVGALVDTPEDGPIAIYSIWLPYAFEIWEEGTRPADDPQRWLAACDPSAQKIQEILQAIETRLADPKYDQVPLVIAGDFNAMSHLDYTAVARDQYQAVVEWPTSLKMTQIGFRDAFRECRPIVNRQADRTWTPRFPTQEQDRIDFVYHRASRNRSVTLSPKQAQIIDQHPVQFPSDHAAVLVHYQRKSNQAGDQASVFRAMSYNIKHGQGMDDQLDLQRTTTTIEKYKPDFVALQEVDWNCRRSQGVNQPEVLAEALDMHVAFGSFMPFQGGHYGLAILSKYPIYRVEEWRLAEGNEPRIALVAEVRLPNDDTLRLVNVHFDWVRDDRFRFQQAQEVLRRLGESPLPTVLLGDFNDRSDSRTLRLFQEAWCEVVKPENDRNTFPSDKPNREIDFAFVSPEFPWPLQRVELGHEPLTSDHRPLWFDFGTNLQDPLAR